MLLRLTVAAVAASAFLCVGAQACTTPGNAAELQNEVLAHLNAERKANGLSPFKLSAKLDKAAQGHACDNAARRSISHDSSDGGTLKTRLKRVGYKYRAAAENTGRGFGTGARAVEWWMNSPKHRSNILLGKAKEIGIGIAVSDAPDSKLHWVLNFGASR
ncbi:CAP domain-containing protein [Tabrizicola sp.]|uniref:CAP domain-containing protein n=1 Tax=Tabrizicola sp. TaxID=2005166 RepID=UPI003F3F6034